MNRSILRKYDDRSAIDFYFDYNKEIIDDIKKVQNRWFKSDEKCWEIDIRTTNIVDILRIVKKYGFTHDYNKAAIIKCLEDEKNREAKEKAANNFDLPKGSSYLVYCKRRGELRVFLSFAYSPTLVDEVKDLEGAKFIKNSRRVGWEININLGNIRRVRDYLSRPYVYIEDPELLPYLNSLVKEGKTLSKESRAVDIEDSSDLVIKGLGGELRPFQKVGVKYALKTKKTFIADDMGCGKTIEALATYQASKVKKCLVVCPNTVKYNWLNEANKWVPKKKAVVLEVDKSKNSVKDFGDINIINYDMLTKIWPLICNKGIGMAIFDESHRLKNKNTAWSKVAVDISKNLEYCLLLSGTPVVNRPAELVNQLLIIDKLKLFGGDWKFKERYCNLKHTKFGWDYSGASNLDELHERLRAHCYIRRMKQQVIKELPSKQRTYIPVVLEKGERKVYEKAEKDIVDWIVNNADEVKKFMESTKGGPNKDERYFEYITRLKVQKAETLVKISKLRKIAADYKVKPVVEWTEDFLLTGKKIVIFCVHRDIIATLKAKFSKYGAVTINGDNTPEERQRNVDAFQHDPKTRVIICNIQAGGVGLTLTAASDVLFVEYAYTCADLIQAEDRCWRIGQTNTVNIWYFFAKDTIDYDMIKLLQTKEKVTSAVTNGTMDDDISESVINASVANLVSKYKRRF